MQQAISGAGAPTQLKGSQHQPRLSLRVAKPPGFGQSIFGHGLVGSYVKIRRRKWQQGEYQRRHELSITRMCQACF